jgi:hypothetical protein
MGYRQGALLPRKGQHQLAVRGRGIGPSVADGRKLGFRSAIARSVFKRPPVERASQLSRVRPSNVVGGVAQITNDEPIVSIGEPTANSPAPAFARASATPIFEAMPQHLDLTDDEATALTRELHEIVENDRYPFSPRIRTLSGASLFAHHQVIGIAA